MFRRTHAIALVISLPILGVLTNGCSSDEKATPQIIFDGRLELGTGNNCKDVGGLFTVGNFGNQATDPKIPSQSVKDGEAFDQGTVNVTCSVVAAGADEFNVSGSVALSGATGGLFRIDGKFKTTGEQTGVHAIFSSKRTANSYEQLDRACIVRYTTPFMGVAAGRMWGEVTCPKAENAGAQTSCEAIAEFRFENCGQ